MSHRTCTTPPPADPALVKRVTADLVALHDMNLAQLRDRYEELYEEPSRSRNAAWLRKKLAWRIQELAYGGLTDRAMARIDEVLAWMDAHQRSPIGNGRRQAELPPKEAARTQTATLPAARTDPRLPPAGTVLRRRYQGVEHEVTVQADGFCHNDTTYDSLSTVATLIAGTRWNGFRFFRLTEPWADRVHAESECRTAETNRGAA